MGPNVLPHVRGLHTQLTIAFNTACLTQTGWSGSKRIPAKSSRRESERPRSQNTLFLCAFMIAAAAALTLDSLTIIQVMKQKVRFGLLSIISKVVVLSMQENLCSSRRRDEQKWMEMRTLSATTKKLVNQLHVPFFHVSYQSTY